jgi:hypothetical protein
VPIPITWSRGTVAYPVWFICGQAWSEKTRARPTGYSEARALTEPSACWRIPASASASWHSPLQQQEFDRRGQGVPLLEPLLAVDGDGAQLQVVQVLQAQAPAYAGLAEADGGQAGKGPGERRAMDVEG